jgi:hypothetical protein
MPDGCALLTVTVAVKVTAWPGADGLGEPVTVVVVAVGLAPW